MTKPLSEQVAGLERHLKTLIDINADLVGENADLIAERDRLKADAMSDLIKRQRLETQVRNREAERDDLQRQAQEARDENDALPRVIGAEELRVGQWVAWDRYQNGNWQAGKVEVWQPTGQLRILGDFVSHMKVGREFVLLADAQQRRGEVIEPEDMRNGDVVDAYRSGHLYHEGVTAGDYGFVSHPHWEFRLVHRSATGYADDDHQDAEVLQWHQPTPRLTVHDLEVAPVGSVLERAYFMPWQKRDDGKWVPDWQLGRNARTSEELIAKGFADATLTTPEAQ